MRFRPPFRPPFPPLFRAPCPAGWLIFALLAACGGETVEPPTLALDLVALFDHATVRQPTAEIDFGHPSARGLMVNGWSPESREVGKDSERLATWSLDDGAEVELFVARPADGEIVLHCAAVKAGDETVERLSLDLNGEDWQEIELGEGWGTHTLSVTADRLRVGTNRIRIHHPRSDPAVGKGQRRVIWSALRVVPRPPAVAAPVARLERGSLFLPFGTRADFFLELPAGSELVLEQLRSRGDPTGRLAVEWQPDAGVPVALDDLFSSPEFRLALTRESGAVGRLSFFALTDAAIEERSAGMVLSQPRVLTGSPPDGGAAKPEPTTGATGPTTRPAVPSELADIGRPNILVYLIDTLRADHLGAYGYPRPTSPHIDQLAAEGILFESSQAQSPWTRASVASVLTGLWPQIHGTNGDEDALADDAVTLAEVLSASGYRTAAITSNGNAARIAGFAQGFDYFKYLRNLRAGDPLATSEDVNRSVFDWLDRNTGEGQAETPFFLFVHTIDPHAPYTPPEPHRGRFAAEADPSLGSIERILEINRQERVDDETVRQMIDLYDAEIAFNDASFGALVADLRERGLWGDLVVVVLADHGEEFYDHGGWTHGKTLYTEMLDTPLVLKMPGIEGGRREAGIVQHVDLMPTLLELVGADIPGGLQGRSFLPLLTRPEDTWTARGVAHLDLRGRRGTSLLDPSWKLIQYVDGDHEGYPELYDRRRDRGEKNNLAPERPELARFLASLREAEEKRAGAGLGAAAVDPARQAEIEAELRALGYIQ